ncbi:Cyclic nucleotide-binding [Brachionus plicatilis]|uniref:Cyclic nucleotide-binding n=1 Tax=Brachionus plicatilis TaxID=10195 RepID=A0A3M7T5Y0_BRAPC|nr:Cyclic nucleotide-binding [Brachionus plicatilis]
MVSFLFSTLIILISNPWTNAFQITSSSLIASLHDLKQIVPELKRCPIDCKTYIKSNSALGFNGPIGALGPLGTIGPVSSHIWSPATEFAWHGDFFVFMTNILGHVQNLNYDLVSHRNNPLSENGPLGSSFWNLMPKINDFTRHMQGLGLFSVLGPLGPLGPLGALGPLGPVGAHGLRISQNGQYIDIYGTVQHKVKAMFNSTHFVEWPLFEKYHSKKFVDHLSKTGHLDTSFMVYSVTNEIGESYIMRVSEPQYITILVTPIVIGKNFAINIFVNDKEIAKVNSLFYTPWIQLYISRDDFVKSNNQISLRVDVKSDLIDCGFIIPIAHCSMEYYLYVVGSTEFMLREPHIQYEGPYIRKI